MKILVFLVFFSISIEQEFFFRSMEKLDASPAEKCLVQDVNGISYVKKCKKGKYCQIFKNGNYIQGICVNFKLPLFVDDACLSNEECLTQNCDNGKCKEQDFCFNDNQCEKGKYCDMHKPEGSEDINTYKCEKMKNENAECYSSEECGKFMFCVKVSDDTEIKGNCKRIGSEPNGNVFVFVNGEHSEKYDKYLCPYGQIIGNTCSNTENPDSDITCDEKYKCKFNSNTFSCKDMKNENGECYTSEECGKFMFCNNNTENKRTCKKIGSVDSGNVFDYINGNYWEKYNKFLCSSGIIEGNTCKTSDDVKQINDDISCDNDNKCSFNSTYICQFNPIENNYYCPYSSLQSKAFAKYKEELNKQFEKYENDDKMWNWNNIRLHGEKKDLKEYLFYYENQIFIKYNVEYDINDDDEDALDVIEFLQQIYLNSNLLKINIKMLFFIISMILF